MFLLLSDESVFFLNAELQNPKLGEVFLLQSYQLQVEGLQTIQGFVHPVHWFFATAYLLPLDQFITLCPPRSSLVEPLPRQSVLTLCLYSSSCPSLIVLENPGH